MLVVLPSRLFELFLPFHGNFLQSLQAIAYESRGYHGQPFFAFLGEAFKFEIGIRLEPGIPGKPALERGTYLFLFQLHIGLYAFRSVIALVPVTRVVGN